ncbi:MAG: hypothetical protein PVJ86_04410 [Phycisphaerales bacterium]|jgi:hypothetical protein
MKRRIIKLVTVAVTITAALIAVQQFGSPLGRAIAARIALSGNVRKCRTLTWKVIFPGTAAIAQCMALEPYYVRAEQQDGTVWLLDRREKKAIMMNPAKKTAKITFFEDQPPDIYETLSIFRNMSRLSAERIGQRQIGETQAIGFDASIGRDQVTVWVDSQTQLPIRVEFLGTNEWSRTEPEFIWSDIVFDVELDESLFRFDLGGYEVDSG